MQLYRPDISYYWQPVSASRRVNIAEPMSYQSLYRKSVLLAEKYRIIFMQTVRLRDRSHKRGCPCVIGITLLFSLPWGTQIHALMWTARVLLAFKDRGEERRGMATEIGEEGMKSVRQTLSLPFLSRYLARFTWARVNTCVRLVCTRSVDDKIPILFMDKY